MTDTSITQNDSLYQKPSFLDRQAFNYRVIVHPKITNLPQPPQTLVKEKKPALMMNDILSPSKKLSKRYDFSNEKHNPEEFVNTKSQLKLPDIFSPNQKLQRSKQFYNYIQEQMAIEYGIDINNGVILKKLKKESIEREQSLPTLNIVRRSKHIVDQIPQNYKRIKKTSVEKDNDNYTLQTTLNDSASIIKSIKKNQINNHNNSRNYQHQIDLTDKKSVNTLKNSTIYQSGFKIVKDLSKRYEEHMNRRNAASLEQLQQEQIICKNSFSYMPKLMKSSSQQDLSFVKQQNKMKSNNQNYNSQKQLLIKRFEKQHDGKGTSFSNSTLRELISVMKE